MTILETRIATARLRRAPRTRTVLAVPDLNARLRAASNRLLDATDTTEMAAQDALGGIVGGLINLMSAGAGAVSDLALVALVERTADGLGCPPVKAPRRPLLRWLRGAR
jgi:hypothetical protein